MARLGDLIGGIAGVPDGARRRVVDGVREHPVVKTYRVSRAAKLTVVMLRGEDELRRMSFGRRRRGLVYRRVVLQERSLGGERYARLELRVGRRRISRAVSSRLP